MTQNEIIEMVREAGGSDVGGHGWTTWVGTQSTEFLERFAKLVAEKAFADGYEKGVAGFMQAVELEREACENICVANGALGLAAAIRSRGQA